MTDERDPSRDDEGPSAERDEDRAAILERRRRFIAAAMMGFASASLGAACRPQPCLEPPYNPPDAALDGRAEDATPQPCLKIAVDSGPTDGGTEDGAPLPCLAPLPPDSGTD